MIKGELIDLKDGRTVPIDECDAIFLAGFRVVGRAEGETDLEIQAFHTGGGLTYREFIWGMSSAVSRKLIHLAEGNSEQAVGLAETFLRRFHKVFKTAIENKEESDDEEE
ncbi:MAG: hypothetical protein ACLTF1_12920 [Clostridium sp.]